MRLLATAGLRLLQPQQVDAILLACRSRLAASGFVFEEGWAQVISGEMEGLYGWAAVNYITGALQASAQVAARGPCACLGACVHA